MSRKLHFQTDFDAAEFTARRGRVMDAIGEHAVAVLQGSPATGAFDLFRQHNDFYYLCGVEVPHAYLLIDGRTRTGTLYLPERDEKHERSEGAIMSCSDEEQVRELTGVDAIKPPDRLADDLIGASKVFANHSEAEGRMACQDTLRHARSMIDADRWDRSESREARFRETMRALVPQSELCDLSPILQSMRLIKSPAEVDLMRRAGELTALAVAGAMRCTRAGLYEYHLAAQADMVFLAGGARHGGYRPIVAGGENIWNAHYFRNDCPLVDGELVLMDYAPDLGCYTSDIGRMWPVGGTYSDWQRELYGFIVAYHKILLRLIRPGVKPRQIYEEAAAVAQPLVEDVRWSIPSFQQAARDVLTFQKHLTHPVGMAVHDVGSYHDDPLRPGIVFALDPQMWVRDQQLYIRVEDTVIVTDDGVENLTAAAPLELDDVERVMREPGVYDVWPQLLPSLKRL